ncbi:MAG: OsmC family protein [Bacteroidota bacterium]
MLKKFDKQFLFEVHLNRISKKSGLLHVKDSDGMIRVATAREPGGEKGDWCPEELFLASVCSSYMTNYIAQSEKIGFEISGFECSVIGHAESVDGKLRFTQIDIYPQIFIAFEGMREKANSADKHTRKNCTICNSINAKTIYHTQLFVGNSNGTMVQDEKKEIII